MIKFTNTLIRRFNDLPVLFLVFIIISGFVIITIWGYYEQLLLHRQEVHEKAMIEKLIIDSTIFANINYANMLVAYLEKDNKYSRDKEAINHFLNAMLQNKISDSSSKIIYVKDFVIEYVYPVNASTSALEEGFNVKIHSRLFEITSNTMETQTPNICSIDLHNTGNMDLMVSMPVIKKEKDGKNQTIGVVKVIFPFDFDSLAIKNSHISSTDDIDFALIREDCGDESEKIVHGNVELLDVFNPVKLHIDLPIAGEWELIAHPKDDWKYKISKTPLHVILLYLIYLIVSLSVYFLYKRNIKLYLKNQIILKIFEESAYVWSLDVKVLRDKTIENGDIVEHFIDLQSNKNITDILSHQSLQGLFPILEHILMEYEHGKTTEIKKTFEIQLKNRRNNLIWYEMIIRGIKDRKADIVEIIGITSIIEERKKMEQQFLESERKFRIITENLRDTIWTIDTTKMAYTYATANSFDILGYSSEEMVGKKVPEIFSQRDIAKVTQLLQKGVRDYRLGRTNKVQIFAEVQFIHKDGHLLWCEISANVLMSEDSEPLEMLGITRVIEDRKEMERRLKESEKKYRLIVDNTKDMISVTDVSMSKFSYVSGACYEMFGYTREEYLQMPMRETMPPESFQLLVSILEAQTSKYLRGEANNLTATFELQQYHKDGSLIWVEISAKMTQDDNGNFSEMIAITRNIEDRKAVEFQILEQKEELEHLNMTKDKFFSIIAHDLRNPFSALLNMSELLNNTYHQLSTTKALEVIKIIYNSSNQIYQLLENLLLWSRSSVGTLSFSPSVNELMPICLSVVESLELQAKVKNIDINIVDIEFKKYVICDSNMIETVIRNLISNAIKFSYSNSTITLEIEVFKDNADYYLIKVSDTGVGIPYEKQSKIFDISEKTSTKGTRNETGTGLGLILCKEFIDKHDCRIWVESEEGKGTTFCFTLKKAT